MGRDGWWWWGRGADEWEWESSLDFVALKLKHSSRIWNSLCQWEIMVLNTSQHILLCRTIEGSVADLRAVVGGGYKVYRVVGGYSSNRGIFMGLLYSDIQ